MVTSPNFRIALLAGTALIFPAFAQAQPAPNARPQGGAVVAGSASIGGDAGRTVINQTTDRAAINWQSFDVGRNQAVQFQQPSTTSVTLNRVISSNPSQIAGQITANGQIAIVNQSGVIFHQGSTVNAAGLVVSTANIANEAFMAGGRMNFNQPGRPDARIENHGTITVREAGLAALVAPQVANHGVIRARMGRVVLAGAETSVVDLHGDGLLSLEVTSPVRQAPTNGQALVTNTGTVTATGGTVVLTAQAVDGIVQDLVRAGGRIAANTDAATGRTGRVVVAGNGGAVRIEGQVSAQGRAAGTTGGDIQILGDRTLIDTPARVNASGRAGGGTIAIGVTPNGAATRRLSQRAGIAPGAVVRADATERGNGGTVLLNSTEYTAHAGAISARGGPQGGNGGFVEVSGQHGLTLIGSIDVSAGLGGLLGTFLLDPTNLTVVADGDASVNVNPADIAGGILAAGGPPTGDAFIAAGTINSFAANLELQATNNLTVNSAINKATGNLILTAGNNLIINSDIVLLAGDLTLNASANSDTPHLQIGALVQVSDTNLITTNGNIGTINTAGRFVGGTLNITNSSTDVSLINDNSVLTLQNLPANGEGAFRNIRSLRVTGNVGGTSNSYTSIDVVGGDLTIAGSVGGGGGFGSFDGVTTRLRASGNVILESTGSIASRSTRIQAGYNFTTGAPDPTAAGGIQLAGAIIGNGNAAATSVDLAAGTGGISQTAGRLVTQNLSLQSGGDASFALTPQSVSGTITQGVGVDVLDASNVSGNLTLNSVPSGPSGVNDLTLGDLVVGGTLDLTRPLLGNIVQAEVATITAGRLNLLVSLGGATLSNDNNNIAQLGTIDVLESFNFRNATNLIISGPVTVRNAAAVIDVVGDLNVTGSVAAQQGPTLRATGNINLAAGSTVAQQDFGSGIGGNVVILAGYDSGSGASNLAGPSSLTMAGFVGGPLSSVPIELGAGTGGIVQTGGNIVGTNLIVRSGGDALLNGASTSQPNDISNLQTVDVAGNFVLDNGLSNLSIGSSGGSFSARTFSIRTAGDLSIFAPITAIERASFRVGSLSINSFTGPPATLTAPLVEIAPFAQVGVEVLPGEIGLLPFQLESSTLNSISTSRLRIGATTFDGVTTTTATEITFSNDFSFASTVDVRATGNVTQGSGTTLDLGGLAGVAGGSVLLNEPTNVLPVISDLSAGTTLTLVTTGPQSLTGTLAAPSVSLTTGGALTESGAGRISAGTLALNIAGAATLNGANAINSLAASSIGGDFRLANTSSQLNIPGGNLVYAAGFLSIGQTGDLVIDGTVSGTGTSLFASGRVQVNGHSAIARTSNLNINATDFGLDGLLQAAGEIRINATNSASLAGTASGSLLQITSPSVTFGGLDATNTPVRLFLGASGTATGTLSTSALSVFGGAGASLFGRIAGITGGPAAAVGRRGTSGGSLLAEPLPNERLYLFNDCSIGAVLCTPIVVPPPSGGGSSGGGGTVTPPEVSFVFDPFFAPGVNPLTQAAVLDPTAAMSQQLRPPVPAFSFRLYRDRSEEGELAPPNVRGEDF